MNLLVPPFGRNASIAPSGVYPAGLRIANQEGDGETAEDVSTWGVVIAGEARVESKPFDVHLRAGGFFALPGAFRLVCGEGASVALIRRAGFLAMPSAGACEDLGRLSYIDGCSDSLLVAPPRVGDPCLNFLHFPGGTVQTQHTHPTIRLGIVLRGKGTAFSTKPGASWEHPLVTGAAFLLAAQEQHSFKTEPGVSMDVVAWHPDSDWGPNDAAHPMKNRTYVGPFATVAQ